MTREQLSGVISGLDDRQISEAAVYAPGHAGRPAERKAQMNTVNTETKAARIAESNTESYAERYAERKRKRLKPLRLKTAVIAAAAAVMLLALGISAYASGRFAPIFHRMREMWVVLADVGKTSPEYAEDLERYRRDLEERVDRYTAAERAALEGDAAPETVTLPEYDGSTLTLSERYYDGEALLLGVHLEESVPPPAVVPVPDWANSLDSVAFYHDIYGDDNLDHLLAEGMEPSLYDEMLEQRSEHAREADLRNISAITLDWHLKEWLSEADYEAAWQALRETGRLCVVRDSVSLRDHVELTDGTDLGAGGSQNLDSDAPDAHSGDIFLEYADLPEAARDRDALSFFVTVRYSRDWYYMELGGPAYFRHEIVLETPVPFTVENSVK